MFGSLAYERKSPKKLKIMICVSLLAAKQNLDGTVSEEKHKGMCMSISNAVNQALPFLQPLLLRRKTELSRMLAVYARLLCVLTWEAQWQEAVAFGHCVCLCLLRLPGNGFARLCC